MSFNSEFEKYAVKHRGISSNTLEQLCFAHGNRPYPQYH